MTAWEYGVAVAGILMSCWMWYENGVHIGVRRGRAEAESLNTQTYANARREGWAAGYNDGLEDAGK